MLFVLRRQRGGGRTKPRPKCVEKPSAARFAHPLRGAEVLVAVRGPSPGEGGGKNQIQMISSSVIVNKKDELNYSRQRHKRSRIHTKSASIQKLLSYKNCFHTKTVRSRTLTKKEYSRNREEKQLERPSHAEERASMCRTKAKL